MPRSTRRLLPRIAAATVAALGLLLLALGALQATVLAPADDSVGTLRGGSRGPVATAPGMLTLSGPRVQVSAGAPDRTVFLGVARARDVEAFLGKARRTEVAGREADGTLVAGTAGTEPDLPDPATADIWATSVRGQGGASLVWPQTPGQWRLVAAAEGGRISTMTMTWTVAEESSAAPALIAVGLVLLVAGGVAFALLRARADGPAPAAVPVRHRERVR